MKLRFRLGPVTQKPRDLHVNERQKIRHYRARSTEERRRRRRRRRIRKKKNAKSRFFTSRGAYVNLHYITMLYTYSIRNQPLNTMVVFKKRDSVPSARYSSVCNVLRQWRIWLIPTYGVYRLYDMFKKEETNKKKEPNTHRILF